MKICVIMGPPNVGKTKVVTMIDNYFGQNTEAICKVHEKDKNGENDIISAYEYQKKIIGMISIGDYPEVINKVYDKLKTLVIERTIEKQIDYLICTSRTKGGTVKYIDSLANDIIRIRKGYFEPNEYNKMNKNKEELNKYLAEFIYTNLFNLFD